VTVVSLVPSATETLVALGVTPIACTRFCDLPGVPTVGGTKTPDVGAVVRLDPDLVVVNDEENRREDADALAAAGLRLHSMSPRAVDEVAPAVAALAAAVGVEPPAVEPVRRASIGARAFVATWRRPYMTCNRDTYASSLLHALGVANVFGDAPTRYPQVALADVAARDPDLVVLPDEPYPFGRRHVPEVQRALPRARVVLVDGRDCFWWGIRTPAAAARLAAVLSR
jgi:ABC-type Fe3+-hydroxamate transport system substrate-binding protein